MNRVALVALVLLVSGCVSLPGVLSAFQLFHTKGITAVEDLSIEIQAAPDEIVADKTTTLFFDITNKGNTTLSNVAVRATDLCVFTSAEDSAFALDYPAIASEDIKTAEWTFKSTSLDIQRNCEIRLATTYDSTAQLRSDIAIASEDELARINRANAAPNLRIFEYSTATPVKVEMTFSKPFPLPTNTDFFVYIKLVDTGVTGISEVKASDFKLEYPSIVTLQSCDDIKNDGTLRANQKFFEGETKTFTCKFKTKSETDAGTIISDIGSFKVDVKYKYTLRQSVNVVVRPE